MKPSVVRASLALLLSLPGTALAALPADFTVDATTDGMDMMPGDGLCADMTGACTLRAAVQEANALGGMTTIALMPGMTYGLSIAGAGEDLGLTGDLDVTAMIRIEGMGATVDAMAMDRAFDVALGASLTVHDLTISNGFVSLESGGAIRSLGDLRVVDSTIFASTASGAGASGGAIFNDRGNTWVLRSTLLGNMADRAGGGVEANEGSTVLLATDLLDNMTGPGPGNGGGFHLTGRGSVSINGCTVEGNTASREGGGLWNSVTGTMVVEGSTIRGNVGSGVGADDGGGGLFNDGGVLIVRDSTVSDNSAPNGSGSGGGLFNRDGDLYLDGVIVSGNTAARAGGGVEALAGLTVLLNSELSVNATGPTPGNGGGLHLTGAGTVHVEATRVTGNTATAEGGGLWNSSTGSMVVIASLIEGNVASGAAADQGGGGVYSDGGTTVLQGGLIRFNVADGLSGSGGGVFNNLGYLEMNDVRLVGNDAQRAGGGFEANVGVSVIRGGSFVSNATGPNPGNGGAVHITGAGEVSIDGTRFEANSATNEGGALWNSATGTLTAVNATFRRNAAPAGRSGYNTGGTMTVNGMVIPVGAP